MTSEMIVIAVIIAVVVGYYTVPSIVATVRLKMCGLGFRMQLRWHWDRLYAGADWSYGIRTFWVRRKLKKDEKGKVIIHDDFSGALNLDLDVMRKLNPRDTKRYRKNMSRKRQLSHDCDMSRDDIK